MAFSTYYIVYLRRETRMMGNKEDDMWSRLLIRFESVALKANICLLSSRSRQQGVGNVINFVTKVTE